VSDYRIAQYSEECFEPQIWRWWWPFWTALEMTTYTGHDWSPKCHQTMAAAVMAILGHQNPEFRPGKKPIYHTMEHRHD